MATDGGILEAARARALARGLALRLTTDPAFRARLEADPAATLSEAGMPEHGVADFMHDWSASAEVGGYKWPNCESTCVYYTCMITNCLVTD